MAIEVGVVAVAGVPVVLGTTTIGAINVYQDEPRTWTDVEVARAAVLADIGAGYVAHVSERERMHVITEQLQEALRARVYIEQAKGILAGEGNISMDEALAALRDHARRSEAPLAFVAQAVVDLGLRPS